MNPRGAFNLKMDVELEEGWQTLESGDLMERFAPLACVIVVDP